jgi:uncharacterized protein VirK/YbjX
LLLSAAVAGVFVCGHQYFLTDVRKRVGHELHECTPNFHIAVCICDTTVILYYLMQQLEQNLFFVKMLVKDLIATSVLVHRDTREWGILKRIKYVLRGLAIYRETREWFDFLHQPWMTPIVEKHPCLFHKLQRPYLNRILTPRQRLETLRTHYRFVQTNFSPQLKRALFDGTGLILGELAAGEEGLVALRLSFSRMEKEGDLTLDLVELKSGIQVASLSFSISRWEKKATEIFVGGLQGNHQFSKEGVVALTRALHGLRPKALLFFTLQQLAQAWGITRLRAVSNEQHIYRHFQKRRNISASYNAFWEDCEGRLTGDRMFDLPVIFTPRPISEIKVNKRSMYRRRYTMLADLSETIHARLNFKGVADLQSPPIRPAVPSGMHVMSHALQGAH